MKTKPNYVKPTPENCERYYWVSADAMALACIGGSLLRTPKNPEGIIALHQTKPKRRGKDGKLFRYHRIRLEVVRTAREAAALDRKSARIKKRLWARFEAAMKKPATKREVMPL